jgi:transmembrane sensor
VARSFSGVMSNPPQDCHFSDHHHGPVEEIFIRTLQGKATPAEAEMLQRWRTADPANELHWQETVRLWNAARPPAPAASRLRRPSAFEIIRAAKQRQRARDSRGPHWKLWLGRAAAAIALVVLGFGAAMLLPQRSLFAGGVISTGTNEMVTVTLADGTLVRLGPNSNFRFGDEPHRREVWLEGEAFFSVAHDRDVPFTVRTAAGDAVVLGTRFGMKAGAEAMQVSIVEGRVALSAGGVSRELVGGEVGIVEHNRLVVRPASGPEELHSDLGNFLAFRSTAMTRVVEEISRHFGLPAEIRDVDVGEQTITASFQDASFTEVVSVICRITASRCTVTSSGAMIGEPAVD